MLTFKQKPMKKAKTFNSLECGNFFVWASNPGSLMLKISDACFFEIKTNITYTINYNLNGTTLSALDILYDNADQCDEVFDVEFEDCTVEWKVVK